jgi:arylformamidase
MELAPEHIALLSRDIPNFEGLANLEALVGEGDFIFVALPIKVENGSGAPVRAAAFFY